VLEELAEEFKGRVHIVKVNIDENPETPVKHGVRSIPTLMLFKNGQVFETQVGALPKSALTDWLNRTS
jgi:thioredoxin 1